MLVLFGNLLVMNRNRPKGSNNNSLAHIFPGKSHFITVVEEREMMMMVIGVSQSCFSSNNKLLQNPTNFILNSNPSRGRITAKTEIEIRVCVNRSCSRQGSRETLETLSGLAPSNISINSCGCLGRCGAGPNLVILPEEIFVSHCGTATRVSNLISRVSGGSEADASKNLTALALRKRAEEELEKKNFSEAEILLSQAIDLKPSGGVHLIYRSRSSARLAMGNNLGALEDAKEALTVAPQYPQAYLCQGDAFLTIGEFDEAEQSYASALQIDPSIRRSRSFKARIAKLQEKLTAADLPP